MDARQLAGDLPQFFDETAEAFRYTTIVIFAFLRPTSALIRFLEGELGDEGGRLAARLIQGFDNETTAAGMALSDLVDLAASDAQLTTALRDGNYDAVGSAPGGNEFLRRLRAYLAEYGWRADSWYMAHLPTWAEDETLPMSLIGRYLQDPAHSPGAALARSAAIREQARREVEARLPVEMLPRFHELLEASNDHVGISEDRAFWQLQISGSIRAPVIALGRKLVAAGAFDEPNDIFFLGLPDVQAVAAVPGGDWRDVIAANKAELIRCQKLMPPPYLGVPPSMSNAPPDLQGVMRLLRGYGVVRSTDERRINGMGASKGVVRGVARVIRGLDEADRLQKGDILVCRTTAPPWTSLFTIAGGVISDAGGILSHTAICAREYGIPAVVGTQVGTQQIPDGALVTLDGEQGVVTIED